MATVEKWTPFGVALDVTATVNTVTRKSATQYTVKFNVSWETYYNGAQTDFGMSATSGGATATLNNSGTISSGNSGTLTGTYSISGNGKATKSVTVTFKNFNTDKSRSATKTITLSVSVPAWTSYQIQYNANGGGGAPGSQTKWKGQNLTLQGKGSLSKNGYTPAKWNTKSDGTGSNYSFGGTYSADQAATMYAVWNANTYTVTFNANGGTGGPGKLTKTHDKVLTIPSNSIPTRTNYKFLGWATSSTSTTVAYKAGANYNVEGNNTLYAVWELSYYKPKITNAKVTRYNTNGVEDDFGTSCYIEFDYDICQLIGTNSIKTITISITDNDTQFRDVVVDVSVLNDASDSVYMPIHQVYNDRSGAYETFNPDVNYSFSIVITDTLKQSESTSAKTIDLLASKFPIDLLYGGGGVAFGKPATKEDTMEVGFAAEFNKPVTSTDGSGSQFLISNSTTDTDTAFRAVRTDIGTEMFVGIGSGGENHGVYSVTQGGWILYATDDSTTVQAPTEMWIKSTGGFVFIEGTGINAGAPISCTDKISTSKGFSLAAAKTSSTSLNCYWNDNALHDLVSRAGDGLTSYFGPGNLSGHETLTCLRGKIVRIYAHSGGSVYLGSSGSTAVTSDKNMKTDIVDIDDKYAVMFFKLQPKTFKYDNPEVKGHRDHVGFIAQDVEEALLDSGLTTEDFAGICIDRDVTISPNDDSSLTEEERKAGEIHYDKLYSLRYEEFIALNTHMIQKAYRIIDQQNVRINELEERIKRLEGA